MQMYALSSLFKFHLTITFMKFCGLKQFFQSLLHPLIQCVHYYLQNLLMVLFDC